jgi:Ca2+-binding RTX toxin-like protein
MARHLYGTGGTDLLVGDPSQVNFFHNLGTGFDSAVGGKLNDRVFMHVDRFVDKVDGGTGEDTIDYGDADRALNIDLSTGVVRANFGGPETPLSSWQEVTDVKNVEDVVGSKFNDTITGSSTDNRLDGGAGSDVIHAGEGNDTLIGGTGTNTLDGGKGTDTADYSSSQFGVIASLATGQGGEFDFAHQTIASQDSYISIENLIGSSQADILIGDANANLIDGGDGRDVVQGGGGGDTLHGGNGDDQIIGNTFGSGVASSTTNLFGDDGNDTLFGSAGKDVMDGGTGNDWADYTQEDVDQQTGGGSHWHHYGWQPGVTVDLSTGTGQGGYAEGDTYANIENVRGTAGNDIITGDGNDNILVGLSGDNVIHGGAGNDTLMGTGQLFGDDNDDRFMAGSSGTTSYDGGNGIDTVDYSQSSNRVVVDLAGTFSAFLHSGELDSQGHLVSFDSYANIENVEGGRNNDMIIADSNDNVVNGNDGNDLVYGFGGNDTINGGKGDDMLEGGAGADHLDGGDGVNTLSYSLSSTGVVVNLANSTVAGGDADGDVISGFQNIFGSDHDDVLIGSNGNNVMFEEAGHNLLVGGGGLDTFAFSSSLTGNSVIADFHIGEDKLAIVGQIGAHDLNDLHISQASGGTLITFDNNSSGSILLSGVNALDFMQHASTEIVFSQTLDPLLHG